MYVSVYEGHVEDKLRSKQAAIIK